MPTTFIVGLKKDDNYEYLELLQRYQEISQGIFYKEKVPEKHCTRNMWIVKPSNLNQGKIIFQNRKGN